MRDAEAKCVFVFLQHFGEEGGLARPAGPAENKGSRALGGDSCDSLHDSLVTAYLGGDSCDSGDHPVT